MNKQVQGSKLSARYVGPFKVSGVAAKSATLELPPAMKIHSTFSTDRFRRYYPRTAFNVLESDQLAPVPIVDQDGLQQWEVLACTARRVMRGGRVEYLVRWQGWGLEHDSWEPASEIPELSKRDPGTFRV